MNQTPADISRHQAIHYNLRRVIPLTPKAKAIANIPLSFNPKTQMEVMSDESIIEGSANLPRIGLSYLRSLIIRAANLPSGLCCFDFCKERYVGLGFDALPLRTGRCCEECYVRVLMARAFFCPPHEKENDDFEGTCCLCEKQYELFGNNADPLAKGRCCDVCNVKVVMYRIKMAADANREERDEENRIVSIIRPRPCE